jgi:hypothetical protein
MIIYTWVQRFRVQRFRVQRFRVQGSEVQGSWVSRFMVEITLNVERGTWNRSI